MKNSCSSFPRLDSKDNDPEGEPGEASRGVDSAEIWPLWLSSSQQSISAILILIGLATMLTFWFVEQYRFGPYVRLETLEPRTVQYRLDANSADWPAWTLLPGISETLARRIVEHREAHGNFKSIDDLVNVRGLGPRSIERIRPFVEFPLTPFPASSRVKQLANP